MTTIDRFTESAARWIATRSTRRSFLGGIGKTAVLAAGGSSIAALFANQAQARVCGQTGVSPKCPTYDCLAPGFFGYCWYASPGCCANGGLKKICDCCLKGWPNVQGYCPDGAAVYCVVESCLEDPRVQTVILDRFVGESPTAVSIERYRQLPTANVAVLANGAHPLGAAIAAPVAADLGAPVFFCPPDQIPSQVVAELTRLGTKHVVVAAPGLSPATLAALSAFTVEVITPNAASGDWAGASVEIATWLLQRGRSAIVAVGADGEALALAPAAAAYAASSRSVLAIGPDAVAAIRQRSESKLSVTVVGNGVTVADATTIAGSDPESTSMRLADVLVERGRGTLTVGIAPISGGGFGAVVAANNVVIVHNDGTCSAQVRDWITARRRRFARAELCTRAPGAMDNGQIYFLQSALNGYDAHQLTGGGGQGLPVYPQPMEERTIGRARVSGSLPSTIAPPRAVSTNRPQDRFPVPTVVMPPPTSWPPGTTTSTLPPPELSTTRPPTSTPSTSKSGAAKSKSRKSTGSKTTSNDL